MSDLVDDKLMDRLRREGDVPEPLFELPRLCGYTECSKPLVRRDGEKPWRFRDRRFCGQGCSARSAGDARRKPRETKVCEAHGCGTVFERDPKRTTTQRWAMRRFCSVACSSRTGRPQLVRRQPDRPVEVVQDGPWRPASWRARDAS